MQNRTKTMSDLDSTLDPQNIDDALYILANSDDFEDKDLIIAEQARVQAYTFEKEDQPKQRKDKMLTSYDVAIVVSLDSTSYGAALKAAQDLADSIHEDKRVGASAIIDYEHDNEGQRVLYLHNEHA